MKLDNDHVNFHPTLPRKSYNPFDSDNETLDSISLMAGNLPVKEDGNGFFDLNAFEKNSDTTSFHLDNGDFLWEEMMPGRPAADNHAVNVNNANGGHRPLSVVGGQLFTNKNVIECELPELIVCYKESKYQLVKDIDIDDGVPSHNEMWFQSGEEESSKGPCKLLDLDPKSNDGLNIQNGNDLDEVKSTLPSDRQKSKDSKNVDGLNNQPVSGQYLVHEFGTGDLMKISELKLKSDNRAPFPSWLATGVQSTTGGLVYDSKENITLCNTDSEKGASKLIEPDLTSKDELLNHGGVVEKRGENIASEDKSGQITLLTEELAKTDSMPEPSTDFVQVKIKPKEEGEISAQSLDHSTTWQESAKRSNHSKISCNSKLESAAITFNSENSSSGISSGSGKANEESGITQNSKCSNPLDTRTMTAQEEGTSSSSDKAGFASMLDRRLRGEMSFSSQAVTPPSSITFTGPVSYSGSISLRSESSAGSTRSFAFPVLQTEWNSSPVRMAKADQRHLKKNRGWVQAVVCCRF